MKKLLLLFYILFGYSALAQTDVYWRSEAPNGNWEWGSSCDGGSDGQWYYANWGGNRKRPDCISYHYLHFSNNNQTTMNLNSNDDFSVNRIYFESSASWSRTINTDNGKKIFFKNAGAKIENYSTVNHTFNVQLSLDTTTEINPVSGDLTLNGNVNTFGNTINVYGNNAKTLSISGIINGAGSLYLKQNSTVILSGANTYTGNTVVEAGTLQLNNAAGALPSTATVTVQSGGTLRITQNQTLATLTVNNGATLVIDSGAILTITGSYTNSGTLTDNGTLILQLSGTSSFPGSSTVSALNALTVASGTVNLSAGISPVNLTISGGTLDLGTYSANSASAGTLTLSGSGTLKIGGTATLPSGYGTHSFSSGSTVEYYGTTQTIAVLSNSQKYGYLTLSGAGQKTLDGNVSVANNLTLQSTASLIVETGKNLTVDNQFFNNGDASHFEIQNNAALVQTNNVTNTGQIVLHKNSNSLYRLDYTMWSSPVVGQNLLEFSPATVTTRFYEYKYGAEENFEGYWPVNPSTTNFTPAKGYLIRMPNALETAGYNQGTTSVTFIGTFTGMPNNGTITIPLSVNANRYTSVGNPYPSPISVYEFFTQNTDVLNQSSALYIWRKRNGATSTTYATLTLAAFTANGGGQNATNSTGGQNAVPFFSGTNTNWLLAPGQGFIVQTKSGVTGSPVLTFNNSMRKPIPTIGQAFMKMAQQQQADKLWLNLTDANNGFSQMAIAYMDEATTGIDYGYDGRSLTDGNNITLYSLAENNTLAVQARPGFEVADVVPLGFVATAAGQYTISLDHTEGVFNGDQNIYLRDTTEGILRNLSEYDYTFSSEQGEFNNRFEVVYTTQALSTATVTDAPAVTLYKDHNALQVTATNTIINNVTVYDLNGRLLYTQKINALHGTTENLNVAQQVLLVQIDTDKGRVTKKLFF
ncbi:autotransporter-associated beta strand repeat-containing protein [Flavobacterium sp. RHBU_3]|uniref:autotransporter-associated beta strand repeat-containing protein n=1 Tax=Flavobacterium sp. RHBU_3 TaxID=3391184 RepID=UPI0039846AE0